MHGTLVLERLIVVSHYLETKMRLIFWNNETDGGTAPEGGDGNGW